MFGYHYKQICYYVIISIYNSIYNYKSHINSSFQHLARLESLCNIVTERLKAVTSTHQDENRSLLASRDRLLREIGRNVRLGKLLKERLLEPLVPDFKLVISICLGPI